LPRPRKRRRLSLTPRPAVYKPAGAPLSELRQVLLLQEELEALRLADLEGLSQAQAAEQMGISRSTFQRMLTRAHQQVALALVEGCALEVEGGTFEVTTPRERGPRRTAGGSDERAGGSGR
jgi:predicted DNA-binding protein (UPF0251 family)